MRLTKLMMKLGGSELCWCGSEFMWLMSCVVKFTVAHSASLQAGCPNTGDAEVEPVGVGARERSRGSGWARGAQLRVYMVRSGSS